MNIFKLLKMWPNYIRHFYNDILYMCTAKMPKIVQNNYNKSQWTKISAYLGYLNCIFSMF